MKRKTITLVVYMLVCISLVSVGFAAWVITGGTTQEASAGITASTVTDNSINITNQKWTQGGVETSNPSFVFGHDGSAASTYAWLFYESDVAKEQLEATYSFTIKVGGEGSTTTIKSVFDETKSSISLSANSDKFTSYQGSYIAAPVITYTVGTQTTTDEPTALGYIKATTENSVNVSIKIQLDWGSITGGENPYTYFNGLTNESKPYPSTEHKNLALDFLGKIAELNGVKYNLNITLAAVKSA